MVTRSGHEKWLDIVASLSRIEQVKMCHTTMDEGQRTDVEGVSNWMKRMRSDEAPFRGLETPLRPGNVFDEEWSNR